MLAVFPVRAQRQQLFIDVGYRRLLTRLRLIFRLFSVVVLLPKGSSDSDQNLIRSFFTVNDSAMEGSGQRFK
jgi:hypothetical protein